MNKLERRVTALALLQVLHVAGWGAYYAVTRMVYAADAGFLLRLASAETLPTAAGLLGGVAARHWGYRRVLLMGTLEGLSLAAAGVGLGAPGALLASVFLASLFWSIAGPQVYALALTLSSGSAEKLGVVLAGATLGYSLGAGLAPALAAVLGPGRVLEAAGLLVAASYLGAAAAAGRTWPRSQDLGAKAAVKRIAVVAGAAAAAYVGTETLGSVYMGRLSAEVGPRLYSLALAAGGLLGAAVRPLAGRLIDRLGEGRVVPLAAALYAVYVPVLDRLHGVAFLAAWLLPLYPVLDTGLYKVASRLLGEALGSSVVSSSYSVTGVVLAAAAERGVRGAVLASLGFMVSSVLSAAALRLEAARGAEAAEGRRVWRKRFGA